MTTLKRSALCAGASALSYFIALLRGDLVCAGEITATLIALFFLFGIAAIVLLVVGMVQRLLRTEP